MMREKVWRGLAVVALMMSAVHAHAEGLACGTYKAADNPSYALHVLNDQNIETVYDKEALASLEAQRRGSWMDTLDPETGYVHRYLLEQGALIALDDSGKHGERYALVAKFPCQPAKPQPPAGRCRKNFAACATWTTNTLNPADLRAICEEGLAFGCKQYLDTVAKQAEPRREPPEAIKRNCDEKASGFDAKACEQLIDAYIGQAFAESIASTYGPQAPLPDAVLADLPGLCARTYSAASCRLFASALLNAGRVDAWLQVKQQSCAFDHRPAACQSLPRVMALLGAHPAFEPAEAMPCGVYTAMDETETLYGQWHFKDRGRVQLETSSNLAGRLDSGAVKIRHDKGSDFVLRKVGTVFVGTDTWTDGMVYAPASGAPAVCAPAVDYREEPMPKDCPLFSPADVSACCDAGKLQGCNTRGNQHALAGNWAGAAKDYARLCAADIRIGCENLARASMEIGDENPESAMSALCKNDARAMACDVLDTTNWHARALERALQEVMKEIDAQ